MQLLDACLTLRTLLPLGLRTLVAAYMYVLRREESHNLFQHVVDEFHCLVVAGAEHVVRHAPHLPNLVRTAGATQFWISRKGSLHVSRQVDLGHNRDVAVGSILHDVANLLLCVEASVRLAVILARVVADDGLCALRTNLGEQRILLYLDAPALVVGEVPVEAVDVVQGEYVDELAYLVGAYEVARHVEVGSAVREARSVDDVSARDGHLCRLAAYNGQRLAQGLYAVEHSRCRCAGDAYALGIDVELVALGVVYRLVDCEHDGGSILCLLSDNRAYAGGLLDIRSEQGGVALHIVAFACNHNRRLAVEDERRVVSYVYLQRLGHDVEVRSLSRCGAGQEECR